MTKSTVIYIKCLLILAFLFVCKSNAQEKVCDPFPASPPGGKKYKLIK
jgi:hypothetical protein